MHLLIVRHGIAEDALPLAEAGADAARALTPKGRRRMRKAARGLARMVPALDVLATSPLRRARETAEIVGACLDVARVEELDVLAPHRAPAALGPWLRARSDDDVVAIVGHEPHLGLLLANLLGAAYPPAPFVLKKGAAAMLEIEAGGRLRARLAWFLQPAQLRRLRR